MPNELQNYGITDVGKGLWRPSTPTPPIKQVQLEGVAGGRRHCCSVP